ncbi:MAG: DUF4105 domain-containing protein [Bacteriovoracaceae bacterium]|nr:DUF4105 domain-containing protein [Bacteriovoracaceae bacterium]
MLFKRAHSWKFPNGPFLFFIFFSFQSLLFAQTNFEELSQSLTWKYLLYYEDSGKGLVKDDSFYLSKNGKNDPKSEIEFLAKHLLENNQYSIASLCRFPLRSLWLIKKLESQNEKFRFNFDSLLAQCHELKDFLKEFAIENASLVFTSYYSYAAASLFGHTFLRLERSANLGLQQQELLDVGVSFGAVVTTENPLLYAINGLLGNFKGVLTAVPYYYKVREYQSFEKRDLWSYQLKLTQNEKYYLLLHLWELASSKFDYSFFIHNCSDIILRVIQAIKLVDGNPTDEDLIWDNQFPFYVVPVDTVKALKKHHLIETPSFRPGQEKIWQSFYQNLSANEQSELKRLIAAPDRSGWKQNAKLLDSYVQYLDFSKANELLKQDPVATQARHEALTMRSKLPSTDEKKIEWHESPPESVHATRRSTLYARSASFGPNSHKRENNFKEEGVGIQYRFAFHDALDPNMGTIPGMSLEFLSLKAIYETRENKISMEEIQLLNLMTFSPWKFWRLNPNYQIRVWWDKTSYKDICYQCQGLNAFISLGASTEFKNNSNTILVYSHVAQQLSIMPKLDNDLGWQVGPRIGAFFWYQNSLSSQMDFFYAPWVGMRSEWYLQSSWETRWHFASSQSWYFRADYKNSQTTLETGWHHYF